MMSHECRKPIWQPPISERHAERASIPLGYQGEGLELRQQNLSYGASKITFTLAVSSSDAQEMAVHPCGTLQSARLRDRHEVDGVELQHYDGAEHRGSPSAWRCA